MNGFTFNSLRRAKMSLVRKVYLGAVTILCPNEVKRQWKKHCIKMQNELNEDHYYERGWYVYQHEIQDCR